MKPTLTEERNPATTGIDTLPTLEILALINAEDQKVAQTVQDELPKIAEAVDAIVARLQRGGRLIYIGAGTSGRLGILDASECPPTFGAPPGMVVGLIAGGPAALTSAIEGAEDDPDGGRRDIAGLNVGEEDCVIGLSASGRTPYVLGGLEEARRRGALAVSLACNRPSPQEEMADIGIALLTGPEVLTGSTRLKAGTAQKMALNMISTGIMIRLGKTYGNLMVDVRPINNKLRERARRIVAEATGLDLNQANEILQACHGEVKTAIVAVLSDVTPQAARERLHEANGYLREAIKL